MPAVLATAVSATVVGALPAALLGATAILVIPELGLNEFEVGASIAAAYGATIVLSLPAGQLSSRLGPTRTMFVGTIATAGVLAAVGAAVTSWMSLVAMMALGGVTQALASVGANHLLAVRVSAGRRGIAYGIKQSAIPMTGIVAGSAIPVLAVPFGWRSAFFATALIGVLAAVPMARARREEVDHPVPQRPGRLGSSLAWLAVAAGMGTAAATALSAFVVIAAVDQGMESGSAGLLLAGGSGVAVVVRIAVGWYVDRADASPLSVSMMLLLGGAVGFAALAMQPGIPILILAATLAFAGGWGYQGLILTSVSRSHSARAAEAMAIFRMGPATGSAAGPLLFGAIAHTGGLQLAWISALVLTLGAALTLLLRSRATHRAPSPR